MTYEEQISLLEKEEFFSLFFSLKAEPRWVMSSGHRSIQLLGLCHHGGSHSALFDPETRKVTCFSSCGEATLLHNWVRKVLNLNTSTEAKEFIQKWIDDHNFDFSGRVAVGGAFQYEERQWKPEKLNPIAGIPKDKLKELYSRFDCSISTLSRLTWHKDDHIDAEILKEFDVAYYPEHRTIVLPHHNINGEIVGIFERWFGPLRREIKKEYPELRKEELYKFPRAKYLPMLRDAADRDETHSSWSFPNSLNLYGLHLAKQSIRETGKAIIFEGAKSVMLARQYGYPYAVASHTFGANLNHISMLIDCGAKEIIFAFDKQYQTTERGSREWELYETKTRGLAEKILPYVKVTRITDKGNLIGYKDSPIDAGKDIFDSLFRGREEITEDKGPPKKSFKQKAEEMRAQRKLSISPVPEITDNFALVTLLRGII